MIPISTFVKATVTYRFFMLIGIMLLAYLETHYNFFKHLSQVIGEKLSIRLQVVEVFQEWQHQRKNN